MIDSSIDLFKDFFKNHPDSTSFASGRVNLIGDHTDYNSGFVMPTPLSLGIEVSLKPTQTRLIQGKTNLFSETERQINAKTDGTWLDFVTGAIKVFYEEFPSCSKSLEKGIQLVVSSNLPSSSGVSSSAALEIALLRAINKIENQNLNQIKLAKLAQKIEHNFIGTKCGLMDQMVVSCGNMNKAIPACTACHSVNGKGNELAGFPSVAGQQKAYLVSTLKAYRSMERDAGDYALVMQAVSQNLSDYEIEALANYMHGLYE